MTDATTHLGWGFFGPVLTATYLWGSWRAYWLLIRVRGEQVLTFSRYNAAVDIAIALLLPVAVAIILWHRHTATRAYQIARTVLDAYNGTPRPHALIPNHAIDAAAAQLRMRRPTGLLHDKVRGHLEKAWLQHQQTQRQSHTRW